MVQELGPGALLFKMDIKNAFRLLPIHPKDFDLLGFKFENNYYFDKCLPFGCSISCSTFEKFSTFLEYLVRKKANSKHVLHYLDDFLGGGRASTNESQDLLNKFISCMRQLNVPLAEEKTEGPIEVLCFLGLELDSVNMVVRIPMDKVKEAVIKIEHILFKSRVTLREVQSVIGLLNFACRAVVTGRPFCRRLINAICGLSKPHHHLRVSGAMKADLQMWLTFLKDFNGVSVFHKQFWSTNNQLQLFSDSAEGEGLGFGVYYAGQWACAKWPTKWHTSGFTQDITFLEIFPIFVSLKIWGKNLSGSKLCFNCDNKAVVDIVNSMTSRNKNVMVVLRLITLTCLEHNIVIKAQHVPGTDNNICDSLSRFQFQRFRQVAPNADVDPQPVPDEIWSIWAM
ncbi:uncharacterized protein LOC128546374 [Mercenaria mercenaria]|uniref:uncharacterized protein LOC128546374 n=1 Tax=Mercenaria mercenaria TaxID=6596 RepID=UPI00234F06FA|nr:uncharacterized protein LOC128546374 [Mercenaria mercenaria]